jgi:hypothetical protein
VVREKIFKWPHPIFTFLWFISLKRTLPFIWTNLHHLYPRIICTNFDWIWRAGSEEDFKKISAFSLFCYHLPLECGYPLPLNKLASHLPKDNLCQACSKLARLFWRRRFSNDSTPFLQFCDYRPFEDDLVLYFNQFEFPSPKDNLYQAWLNLACWVWGRFLKIFSVFLLFRDYLPLEKGYPFHLNKLESPLPNDNLCQDLSKLTQWFWRRSRKCKSLQTYRQTDAGQQAIRKAHLSFQLRWTKNDEKVLHHFV